MLLSLTIFNVPKIFTYTHNKNLSSHGENRLFQIDKGPESGCELLCCVIRILSLILQRYSFVLLTDLGW